jgi:hypothetical protein
MTIKEKFENNIIGVEGEIKIADEFAIDFAEWKEKNNYWHSKDNKCFFKFGDKQTKYTIKELLEIYKKEKKL